MEKQMNTAQTLGRYVGIMGVNLRTAVRTRLEDDRGEGVISMAIAILIIATIGAAVWLVFDRVVTNLGTDTETQIGNIG